MRERVDTNFDGVFRPWLHLKTAQVLVHPSGERGDLVTKVAANQRRRSCRNISIGRASLDPSVLLGGARHVVSDYVHIPADGFECMRERRRGISTKRNETAFQLVVGAFPSNRTRLDQKLRDLGDIACRPDTSNKLA
jgi:hypothetical protein